MRLIIIGPQGCGKGTQARLLAERLQLKHISMGNELRKEVMSGSHLGKKMEGILERGEFVPHEITYDIARRFTGSGRFIFDGFPRSVEQAIILDTITPIDAVIVLDISNDTVLARIDGRVECAQGHNFHPKHRPSKKPEICDIDGLPLSSRNDDTNGAIKKRLSIYHENKNALLTYYKERTLLINAEGSIDEVHDKIIELIQR